MGHYDDCYEDSNRESWERKKREWEYYTPRRKEREDALAVVYEKLIADHGLPRALAIINLGHLQDYLGYDYSNR